MQSLRLNSKGGMALKLLVIGIVAALVAAAIIYYPLLSGQKGQKKGPISFQKGMGFCSWSADGYNTDMSDESLKRMKSIGIEWVAILVTWYQTNPWSSDIKKTSKTPTDESIRHAIQTAHELGMKVMIKPHLDLLDKSDGSWRGEIGCLKEDGWDEWFEKYEKFLMHYIAIAKEEKVEMFCVGTELSCTAAVKGYLWVDMINKIKSQYKGLLTYAAHWDRYMDIRFWDQLDYVGINAYFPLTEKNDPTKEELKEGWKKWVEEMAEFQKEVNKPIIFPEIGCNSADGAAIRPWEHVTRSEVNLNLQEKYYEVLYEVFWDKEWFYGMYWWYWGTNKRMGGKYNRGFTPQNKPAETVVRTWYEKPVDKAWTEGE